MANPLSNAILIDTSQEMYSCYCCFFTTNVNLQGQGNLIIKTHNEMFKSGQIDLSCCLNRTQYGLSYAMTHKCAQIVSMEIYQAGSLSETHIIHVT